MIRVICQEELRNGLQRCVLACRAVHSPVLALTRIAVISIDTVSDILNSLYRFSPSVFAMESARVPVLSNDRRARLSFQWRHRQLRPNRMMF